MMPTGLLIIFVLVLVWICSDLIKENDAKKVGSKKKPVRIDLPHYFEEDDHECSACGARFEGKRMTCPKCGTRFTATKEEDGEFMEEMALWDDD